MLAGMKWAGDTDGKAASGDGATTGNAMVTLPGAGGAGTFYHLHPILYL